MDFNLSREHQMLRKMMAEFTEKRVKPLAAETDRTCEYPRENIEKLFDLGVMAAPGPILWPAPSALRSSASSAPPPATSWPPTTACAATPS